MRSSKYIYKKCNGGGVPYIPPRYPVHFPGGQADAPWQASPPGIESGSSGSKSTNPTTRPSGGSTRGGNIDWDLAKSVEHVFDILF